MTAHTVEIMASVERRGVWINTGGYALRKLRVEFWPWPGLPSPWRKPIWEFQNSISEPLTYRAMFGYYVQPDRHRAETDLGSIPVPLRGFFPESEFALSYILHDSACRDHGLWTAYTARGPFRFHWMTSLHVHYLLRESIVAEGGSAARAATIWACVRLFGPRWSTTRRITPGCAKVLAM